MTQVQYAVEPQGRPLAVMISIATLEQLVAALNEVDQHVDLKRYDTAPNEVLFDVVMEAMVKGRAALANAESTQSKPYAWRNPMNGVVISNDKKERLLCVGRGYPNFSEPLYVAGAKP